MFSDFITSSRSKSGSLNTPRHSSSSSSLSSSFCCLLICSTPSNTQCASFADTYHLVDTSACTCGDKAGLLQLSSLGYFRTTVTTAAVCLQRRHSSRVLRKEVGAHNSTYPWTALAESSGENSVPVMCSRVSLPYRHGAVIPCRDPPLNCRRRFTSASSECF